MREHYRRWTEAERAFIMDTHDTSTDDDVAAKLTLSSGKVVTTNMIRRQRRRLGIIKKRGRPTGAVSKKPKTLGVNLSPDTNQKEASS